MIRLMLAFALFGLVTGSNAQVKQKQKQAIPNVAKEAFDPSVESLPKNFKGHDIAALIAGAKKLDAAKGELETSAEYAARMAAMPDQALTKHLRVGDTLAFVYDDTDYISLKYDADAQRMMVRKDLHGMSFTMPAPSYKTIYGSSLVTARKQKGAYTGTNAYGVRTKVRKQDVAMLGICPMGDADKYGFLKSLMVQGDFAADKLRAYIAQRLGGVLVYGKLVHPYVLTNDSYKNPTIHSPVETDMHTACLVVKLEGAWAFNILHGDIFTKSLVIKPYESRY